VGDFEIRFNAAMGQFQQELVRWNRQINLVSRKDTSSRVARLISQCRGAWQRLNDEELGAWTADGLTWYFDLGSGGGLPGYVWHLLLAGRFGRLESLLVEPREKRAWFLGRLNAITPETVVGVGHGRWGDVAQKGAKAPNNVLISLKALRLSDFEVLDGLISACGSVGLPVGCEVVIARFYPPEQQWTSELALELGASGENIELGASVFQAKAQRVLSPGPGQDFGAALVVSSYCVSA